MSTTTNDVTRNPLGGKNINESCKVYSCRMCRKLLFTSDDLLPHDATRDARGHKKFKFQAFHYDEQKEVCTSLFLDPDSAVWVAKESRRVQQKRLNEMDKVKNAIEDEEIYGLVGGRPKTPEMTEEQKAELARQIEEDARITAEAEAAAAEQAKKEVAEKKAVAAADSDDDDSDEEIISSDDEDAKKKKKPTTTGKRAPAAKKPAAFTGFKKEAAPTPAAPTKDEDSDSDETIGDDEVGDMDHFDDMDDEEDFFDDMDDIDDDEDEDDFKTTAGGAAGARNAARRNEFRVKSAAIDIVDPDTVYCPHCTCKIGQQNWIGSQCSCGAWVTPAFKVHAKAVDEITGALYLRLYK